jgi:hypothetical protein
MGTAHAGRAAGDGSKPDQQGLKTAICSDSQQ